MSEEKDTNQQQPSPEEQLANTIRMQIAQAFNTGLQSQPKTPVYHLSEVVQELESFFTEEFKKNAGESVPDEAVKANVLFLVQLATLGHILPRVCQPDKDFQVNLFKLIEERAMSLIKASQQQSQEQGKIIHEEKKIIVP
jgi:hypothetical protein|tara:strand:- start:5373 stop:5792 length:420 start_codon:yes stop_codon:yes gene_type:complete